MERIEWLGVNSSATIVSLPLALEYRWSTRRAAAASWCGCTGRANEFLADSFSTTAAFADARWGLPHRTQHANLRALGMASVLLYPKTLGGCAVFSGFLPFNSSFAVRVTAQAKKTPVLWIHGRVDSLIPIEEGRDGTKCLLGLAMNCEFKVYDRLGHSLEYFELDYCQRWVENILHRSGREGLVRRVSRNMCLCVNLFNCSYQ